MQKEVAVEKLLGQLSRCEEVGWMKVAGECVVIGCWIRRLDF